MTGCGPGRSCCASCAAAPPVSPPVGFGDFGFWAAILSAAKAAASAAPHVATIVAADRSLDLDGPGAQAAGGGSAADQAAAIYRAEQARASFPGALLTPAAMIGLGAVAVALIARR